MQIRTADLIPEVREEEERVRRNDPLLGRRFSKQMPRSPFPTLERFAGRTFQVRLDSARWPVNGGTVNLDNIPSGELNPEQMLIAQEMGLDDAELMSLSE